MATQAGLDVKWNQQDKMKLSYCVSTAFGSRHAAVVQQMENATGEWEKVASVDFTHDAAQDATCGPTNQAVVFDVRPVNVGDYLARAFFPDEPRAARNVLIDESSFDLARRPRSCSSSGFFATSWATRSGSGTSTPGRNRARASRTATGGRSRATTRSRSCTTRSATGKATGA